jgi:hypothetical protein
MITRVYDSPSLRPTRAARPVRRLLLPMTTSRRSAAVIQGYDRTGKPLAPVKLSTVDARM